MRYPGLVAMFLCSISSFAVTASAQVSTPAGLRIVVIAGEDAVNIVQQKTAVAPVVEVRDRNNLPVAGVPVTFTVAGAKGAAFGGASTLTVTTNAAGQAAAAGFSPLTAGAVQINVQAAFQGQVVAATIAQTNVMTAAEVAAAAASSTGAAGSGTGAAGGAGGGGGGVSAQTLAVVGGTAGALGAGLALSRGEEKPRNQPPSLAQISASPTIGLQSATAISFVASATDPNNDPLTYQWDFGDGTTSALPNASHVYDNAGTYVVRLTVRDGSEQVTSETSVTIRNLNGRWAGVWHCTNCGPAGLDVAVTIDAVQNASAVVGTQTYRYGNGTPQSCPLSGGTVRHSRAVQFSATFGCAGSSAGAPWQGTLNENLDRLDHAYSNGPFFLVRQ